MADYVSPDARRRIAGGLMAAQYDRATPEEGNVTQRHGLLPLATYDNGRTGLAFPGFVAEPVQSFNRLLENGYTSGDTQGVEDAFNVAGAAMMGGLAAPKPAGNAVGIFGGRLAKTADQAALARAEELAAKGAPREQIWNDTGWFQGPDKKWRFEIDDSGMAPRNATDWTPKGKQWDAYEQSWVDPTESFEGLKNSGKSNSLAGVNGAFTHDELIKAYPDIANARLGMQSGRNGLYEPPFNNRLERITLGGDLDIRDAKTLAAHEIQHAIQNRERFAHGAALRGWGDDAERSYRNTSGEVEARTVEKRIDLTAAERRARPPWIDYDVPEANQIVRFDNSGPQMSLGSAGGDLKGAALGAVPDMPPSYTSRANSAQQNKTGIRAFHGSPNDFDRFDIEKVNEAGRMQHGWGLNFATADSGFTADGAKHYGKNVYEVNLNVSPDELLRIDQPLRSQPKAVQDLYSPWRTPDEPIGKATSHTAAQLLRDVGIKGQTDGGVVTVFDDKLIEILRKYGLLGMAGGAAAAEYGFGAPSSRPASPQYRPGDA